MSFLREMEVGGRRYWLNLHPHERRVTLTTLSDEVPTYGEQGCDMVLEDRFRTLKQARRRYAWLLENVDVQLLERRL